MFEERLGAFMALSFSAVRGWGSVKEFICSF